MSETSQKIIPKWHHPSEVMKIHKLKQKKRALQARINGTVLIDSNNINKTSPFENILLAKKRKNPFLKNESSKKIKSDPNCILDESSDQTLFKLFHEDVRTSSVNNSFTSFDNILNEINKQEKGEQVEIVKAKGENRLPIDWTLKHKMRLLSTKQFPWNQKLKISEEASGITAFARCLDNNTETTLDTSPNAKFHQCCLYWQQPSLPWISLFPRTGINSQSIGTNIVCSIVKDSLQLAWSDSLRSLYQLIRTRQCPYFYACANNFTILFRAGGICGFSDVHVLITPTTRGFRHALRQEDIDFKMPLKIKRNSDQGYTLGFTTNNTKDETNEVFEEDAPDEHWLKSMGINAEDIKQINYTQDKIIHKTECEIDNSEQSLVLIQGVEVHAFYNFLINCKSCKALTGPYAGIPPTLLAPVAFHGASLNALKVRDNRVHLDNMDYYSLEITGPILPSTIHNLFSINLPENCTTVTFSSVVSSEPFSKVKNLEKSDIENKGRVIFGKENLSDCGLLPKVLKHFCAPESKYVTNVEYVKYNSDNNTYTWS